MNANDRSILSITMLGHGMVHAYELSIPIFLGLWMSEFGLDTATMGALVAAGYALYGIGALPGGVATDAYGSRRLLVWSLLGMGASFLVLSFAPGPLGLAVALVCWGVAASVYHPAGLRLISTGVTQRGTGFAWHGIAGNFGIAFGPLLAVLLLTGLDWRITTGVFAAMGLVAALYTASVSIDETAAVDGRDRDTATRDREPVADGGAPSLPEFVRDTRVLFAGGFLLVLPIVILEGFFYRGVLTFLPDMLAEYSVLSEQTIAGWDVEPSRYVYVSLLAIGMAGQYVGGKLTDRVRPDRAAVGAFLLLAALSVAFVPAASSGLGPLLLVSAVFGFVLFGEQPLLQAVVADYSRSNVRGLSYGYMFLGVFGVGALGAAASGAILDYASQRALFLLLAVVPLAAAAGAALLSMRDRG